MFFFVQAEDGIRDLVRSRGLGDVYKRQGRELVDDLGATTTQGWGASIGRTGLADQIGFQ